MKKCIGCGTEKPLDQFYKGQRLCKICHNAKSAAYRLANKEKLASYMQAYYQNHKETLTASKAAYKAANLEKHKAYQEKYRLSNKKKWAHREAKRRALKLCATPAWADEKAVQAYYDVAAFFNKINGYVKYHVDHIIPLQGKTVSGLHVHTNLRVIPASENIRKKNHFEIQS